MTEREWLIGLFNLVGALVERLTGETFVLCIEDAEGNRHHVYPSTHQVIWTKGGAEDPCADPKVSSATPFPRPDGLDANSPEPHQVLGLSATREH